MSEQEMRDVAIPVGSHVAAAAARCGVIRANDGDTLEIEIVDSEGVAVAMESTDAPSWPPKPGPLYRVLGAVVQQVGAAYADDGHYDTYQSGDAYVITLTVEQENK